MGASHFKAHVEYNGAYSEQTSQEIAAVVSHLKQSRVKTE